MAIEDYWASTARNAKDVAQYLIYPMTKLLVMAYTHDSYKANTIAGLTTSAFYTGLTETFLGREMDGFDQMARNALAAEKGVDPDKIKFSDYFDSENSVIKRRMKLFVDENWQRYPVGTLMPLLPTIMEHVTRWKKPASMRPNVKDIADGETRWRDKHPKPIAPTMEHMLDGWKLWDMAVYGGIALLWLQETFHTDKTFVYQGRKEMENNESLGLKIGPNNIAGLYNRARTDAGLEMVQKKDRNKVWPLFELLAKKFNEDPDFGLPEMTYLVGMGKLNIFARDANGKEIHTENGELVVNPEAMKQATAAIEHVSKVGLKGIREEKQKARETLGMVQPENHLGALDRLGRGWMDMHFNFYRNVMGKQKVFNEDISPRDPGEVPLGIA